MTDLDARNARALSVCEARSLTPPLEVESVYICEGCWRKFDEPIADEHTDEYVSPCCRARYMKLEDDYEG